MFSDFRLGLGDEPIQTSSTTESMRLSYPPATARRRHAAQPAWRAPRRSGRALSPAMYHPSADRPLLRRRRVLRPSASLKPGRSPNATTDLRPPLAPWLAGAVPRPGATAGKKQSSMKHRSRAQTSASRSHLVSSELAALASIWLTEDPLQFPPCNYNSEESLHQFMVLCSVLRLFLCRLSFA